MNTGTETTVAVIQIAEPAEQEQILNEQVTEIESRAKAIVVESEKDYTDAAEFGRMLKQHSSDVKEFWKPLKEAAHKAHAEICAKEKAMLQPLVNAEKILKQSMGAYIAEQERKRREAEEAARKAAQAEIDRKMQEAISLDAAGDSCGAEAAMAEAEIMDSMSKAVTIETVKPKAAGVASSRDWEITSIDTTAVPMFFAGIEIRPVDTAAVMRLIRASKGTANIPGISYKETAKIAFRR